MVLGGVARDGKVYVLHVADDPNEPKSWSPRDLHPYRTRHDVWLRGLSPCGGVGFNPALRRFAPRGEAGSGLAAPAHEPGSGLCPGHDQRSCGARAFSPVHRTSVARIGNPLSRVRRRRLARVRFNPLSQPYNPTRHGDQLLLAMHLLEWLPFMNQTAGCNTPLRIAPTPLAQPPPLSPPALRCCAPRGGKQVPVWLRQPMNRAEGSAATRTNGHNWRTALSLVHAQREALTRNPLREAGPKGLSASQNQSSLALRKTQTSKPTPEPPPRARPHRLALRRGASVALVAKFIHEPGHTPRI